MDEKRWKETVAEAAPEDEVTEVAQSEDEVSEKAKTDYETIFRKFVSYGSEPVKSVEEDVSSEPEGSQEPSSDDKKGDEDEPREAKTIDTDAETSNLNSIDSVGSTTLLPEFVPKLLIQMLRLPISIQLIQLGQQHFF